VAGAKDVAGAVRPDYAIVDGIVGMEGNGPISGTPIAAGVLVFGDDPVATGVLLGGGHRRRIVAQVTPGEQVHGVAGVDLQHGAGAAEPAAPGRERTAKQKLARQSEI